MFSRSAPVEGSATAPAASTPMDKTQFTFRKCVWLCVPALVVGAILRIWFLMAIPEGSYSADSSSFFEPTRRLIVKHRWDVSEKRRWLYPVLLLPTAFMPSSPVRIVPIAQHLMGLVTILGVGWVVGNLTKVRALTVPAVTLLYAVWPRVLWYEHEVMAEAIFIACFILMVALAFPAGALKDRRRLFWFLVAAGLVVSIRPHGRGIWGSAMVFAVLIAGWPGRWDWKAWASAPRALWGFVAALCRRNWESLKEARAQVAAVSARCLRWDWKCLAAVLAGIVLIKTSGNPGQGNWLLLNSTLPLVDLEGEKFAKYRAELKPLILETRAHGLAYAATQENYKKRLNSRYPDKVSPEWAALTRNRPLFSEVCATFAHEALLNHPFRFLQLTSTKCLIAMRADASRSNFDPPEFWKKLEELDASRWEKNAREMQMAFGVNSREEYEALKDRRRNNQFAARPFLSWVSWNFSFVEADIDEQAPTLSFHVCWMGVLALAGLLISLFPSRFKATVILWMPAFAYFFTVFAIGDRLPRFAHPVEWVGWVLAAVAVDAVLTGIWGLLRRKSSSPTTPVPA
jgi:hypothetical protein